MSFRVIPKEPDILIKCIQYVELHSLILEVKIVMLINVTFHHSLSFENGTEKKMALHESTLGKCG